MSTVLLPGFLCSLDGHRVREKGVSSGASIFQDIQQRLSLGLPHETMYVKACEKY